MYYLKIINNDTKESVYEYFYSYAEADEAMSNHANMISEHYPGRSIKFERKADTGEFYVGGRLDWSFEIDMINAGEAFETFEFIQEGLRGI